MELRLFIISSSKYIFLLFLLFLFLNTTSVFAEENSSDVTVSSEEVISEFPLGIRFKAVFHSEEKLSDIRVFFKSISSSASQYAYMELFSSGYSYTGDLFYRTDTGNRYIPPGTILNYWFVITTESGEEIKTKPKSFTYEDSRYTWDKITKGPITVMFHGPMKSRAERLADAAIESLEFMAPVIGVETKTPIVVTLYNNNSEMIGAIRSKSMTTSRELITEGQAFHSQGVVLVLAGRRDIGTVTHEITHILVGRATGSVQVPLWLNEGLAEYGNMDKSISYIRFLEWAMDTNRLLPFSHLKNFPGDPNLILVAYGQSRSMVKFLLDNYGENKMVDLLSELKSGSIIEKSVKDIYGKDLIDIESDWRESIGAPPYIPPDINDKEIEKPENKQEFKILTLSSDDDGIDISNVPSSKESDENDKSISTNSCYSAGKSDLSFIGIFSLIICLLYLSRNKIR